MAGKAKATEIFYNFLKRKKFRITPERFEILDATIAFQGHFTADQLYIFLKSNNSRISRATVYNTLELLKDCELVSMRNFGDNTNRYESAFDHNNHDHLICLDCGRIIEFTDKKIKKIQQQISEKHGFESVSYSFSVFVHCKNKQHCPYYHK